ncbi:MAG: glycosyltransferase family 39 protein, partial [Candidatus Moraniibacteriota bacterium]
SYGFFLRIVIGSSLWATLLVALGWLSALTPGVIWVCLAGIALFEWRYLLSLCRYCLGSDVWHLDVKSSLFALALFGLFLVALNLSETIRPEPTGFDDMTYYMDHVHRMQAAQAFLPGGNPFPFELTAAAVGIASHEQTLMLALSLGVYGLLLGAAILFAFGRAIWGANVGAIAAVLTLSIPMGAALALNETKPDAWLFPVTTLFFWSLIRWLQSRDISACFLALYLFSFALTIKLTALFLLAPLGIGILIVFLTRQSAAGSWQSLRTIALAGIIVLLPVLPWLMLSVATHPPGQPYEFSQVLASYPPDSPSLHRDIALLLTDHRCQSTAAAEDFTRFVGQRGPIATLLFLPWDITMNLTVSSFATEFGFLFLAILPLWLWYTWSIVRDPTREHLRSPSTQLILLSAGYLLVWLCLAQHVPWYGYPVIALLSLLAAEAISRSRSVSIALFRFLAILFVVGLIGNTLVRMKFSGSPEHLRYAGGTLSAEDFLDTTFPGLKTLRSAINRPSLPRVYITGSRLLYAFDDHTQRTFNDPHLDTFNCLFDTGGSDGVLETFRALDIQYVFFSRILLRELQHDQNQTFRAKIERFTDFTGHQLRVVWGSADYILFEVPPITLPEMDRPSAAAHKTAPSPIPATE